jgi:hypothetical protein
MVVAEAFVIANLAKMLRAITQRAIIAVEPFVTVAAPSGMVTCPMVIALDAKVTMFCPQRGGLSVDIDDLLPALEVGLRARTGPTLARRPKTTRITLADTS